MHRNILLILAGLCLALITTTSCNNDGPVTPNSFGEIVFKSHVAGEVTWVKGTVAEIVVEAVNLVEPIESVEFYLEKQRLDGFTYRDQNKFMFHWNVNIPPGGYKLHAIATTASGQIIMSEDVSVTIISGRSIRLSDPSPESEVLIGTPIYFKGEYIDHNNTPLKGKAISLYVSFDQTQWDFISDTVTNTVGQFELIYQSVDMPLGTIWFRIESEDEVANLLSVNIISDKMIQLFGPEPDSEYFVGDTVPVFGVYIDSDGMPVCDTMLSIYLSDSEEDQGVFAADSFTDSSGSFFALLTITSNDYGACYIRVESDEAIVISPIIIKQH